MSLDLALSEADFLPVTHSDKAQQAAPLTGISKFESGF